MCFIDQINNHSNNSCWFLMILIDSCWFLLTLRTPISKTPYHMMYEHCSVSHGKKRQVPLQHQLHARSWCQSSLAVLHAWSETTIMYVVEGTRKIFFYLPISINIYIFDTKNCKSYPHQGPSNQGCTGCTRTPNFLGDCQQRSFQGCESGMLT